MKGKIWCLKIEYYVNISHFILRLGFLRIKEDNSIRNPLIMFKDHKSKNEDEMNVFFLIIGWLISNKEAS